MPTAISSSQSGRRDPVGGVGRPAARGARDGCVRAQPGVARGHPDCVHNSETVIEYELDVVVNGHPPIRLGCSVSPLEKPSQAALIEMRALDPHLAHRAAGADALQQEANRELLRNLAHEIKNPLGGIRGAAQLLEHELPRECLARIHPGHHQGSRPAAVADGTSAYAAPHAPFQCASTSMKCWNGCAAVMHGRNAEGDDAARLRHQPAGNSTPTRNN